ncbi:hypothetical protein F383_24402 [Gossypium arboreum]|uniref:Uncharacterized protein n=1 Tax=Gossypium arboreum TaxID=29729 RepID=A0A0B0P9J3_GOSAR|nr:hypothetical protein F383_24402 [Gossypium arboreum]
MERDERLKVCMAWSEAVCGRAGMKCAGYARMEATVVEAFYGQRFKTRAC